MDFDCPFASAEAGPRAPAHTQGDRGAVQGNERILEVEAVLRADGTTPGIEHGKERLRPRHGAPGIGLGKSRALRRPQPEESEGVSLGSQRVGHIQKTVTSSQLRKDERTKLASPAEPTTREGSATLARVLAPNRLPLMDCLNCWNICTPPSELLRCSGAMRRPGASPVWLV
jgi:hypothetical protein